MRIQRRGHKPSARVERILQRRERGQALRHQAAKKEERLRKRRNREAEQNILSAEGPCETPNSRS